MTKVPFTAYSPAKNGMLRSLDEATSEIQREMDVRRRLYDRWVSEGRLSWVDAHDRLERLMAALAFLLSNREMPNAVDDDGLKSDGTAEQVF